MAPLVNEGTKASFSGKGGRRRLVQAQEPHIVETHVRTGGGSVGGGGTTSSSVSPRQLCLRMGGELNVREDGGEGHRSRPSRGCCLLWVVLAAEEGRSGGVIERV